MLLVTGQLIKRSLATLRTKCDHSTELAGSIDSIVAISDAGEINLREPLLEAGAVLPALSESTASAVVAGFIASIPGDAPPAVFAAEVISTLRQLVQHIELKALLAAETALLVGQASLSRALLKWSGEWRACAQSLRSVTVRVRAKAYIADMAGNTMTPQFA